MSIREVTVGREPSSDILYGPECVYVSSRHAIIYQDGNRLVFKDTSTNGTFINNMKVHQGMMYINVGDNILLAGKYPLTWNQIGIFFPLHELGGQRRPYATYIQQGENIADRVAFDRPPNPVIHRSTGSRDYEPDFKWNWGAFALYPLWGFANGMGWAILVSFVFGFLYPIPNIVFGVCGSKWAWKNKQWRDVEHFRTVQNSWAIWGIIITSINIILFILIFIAIMATM